MAKKMILIAGPSASGKTRYAAHLEERFSIPVISKDGIKETLFEALSLQADSIEAVQKYGSCAYDLLFYFAERLMRSGGDLALESNFTPLFLQFYQTAFGQIPVSHPYHPVRRALRNPASEIYRQGAVVGTSQRTRIRTV